MSDYLYTSMSGALQSMTAQRIHANNLANVNTAGFRRDFENAGHFEIDGPGYDGNVHSKMQTPLSDFTPGMLEHTGRDLDVAIKGGGLFTVIDDNGNEAYTRQGSLSVDQDGVLRLGDKALGGNGGPIAVGDFQAITIGSNGNIAITLPGGGQANVGQMKLVAPEKDAVTKGADGLFRTANGAALPQAENVVVASGHLEGSNVNAVDEMVANMAISRNFEVQVKMMKAADENAAAGSRLVRGS